ncbi:MAG: L-serine ammonia-lyase, iron-sulfur-dependent subunit beta [Streptococcaceae bacterium]|jgi:L-serine dehydratase|nr:L-serine ammonia-lyase, iron-sulfur-dependent subunit beta [Streptococcaceae bacterium]
MKNLRYRSIFDIIGPIMIGPSSSHTAGAARIGRIVRTIFGEEPEVLDIHLYGSFAKTYRGHGTDVALVGGVLGMAPDDVDLPNSLKIAHDLGIEVSFVVHKEEKADHPNTARLVVKKGARHMEITGISVGGGNIQVTELNGFNIALTMGTPTFIVTHRDVPGMIARVTDILGKHNINIAQMNVTREAKGDKAIMIIEVDTPHVADVCEEIQEISNLEHVNFFG